MTDEPVTGLPLFGGRELSALLSELLRSEPACNPVDAVTFTGPDADESGAARRARENAARVTCIGCPARSACMDYALTMQPDDGVWAGYTADEIRGMAGVLSKFGLLDLAEVA
ncbi:WhiB family transcriptional regulator [Spongiactinospora sp. TRM90649]|uniref:WhiB family transcriptional regulator n=1 Tax=Spongiactinospora sp. TRM90649 TaxID=3031114 RepID=UPI0023F9BD38|nr:WhiB family transcriptional regulator [Spongiactinospora sp. TRM90649]MDF5758176.1 WhiB family transcriptional regulator [Spongiactinospora sp. TRM90649]